MEQSSNYPQTSGIRYSNANYSDNSQIQQENMVRAGNENGFHL